MGAIDDESLLTLNGREEWRSWLEEKHLRDNGVWLLIRKVAGSKGGVYYADAVEEAICFGWIDGKMKSIDKDRYRLWFSPRRRGSVWSKSNRERYGMLLAADRIAPSGAAAVEEAKKNGKWEAAYSGRERPEVPDDLKRELEKVPEAWTNFSTFAPSYQAIYTGWVNSAKRNDTRIRRIARVVERSTKNQKPGIDM